MTMIPDEEVTMPVDPPTEVIPEDEKINEPGEKKPLALPAPDDKPPADDDD